MRIVTLLNRIHYLKSFVYIREQIEMIDAQPSLVVDVVARKNSRPICSGCGSKTGVYDHQKKARRFGFVPLWGIPVYLCYLMRRVNCQRCGVKVEALPWCDGKSQLTRQYQLFLAQWARRLSWQEVARVFHVGWNQVYRSVKSVVEYGLAHRDLDQISAIGVDEIQYGQGHHYLTLCINWMVITRDCCMWARGEPSGACCVSSGNWAVRDAVGSNMSVQICGERISR